MKKLTITCAMLAFASMAAFAQTAQKSTQTESTMSAQNPNMVNRPKPQMRTPEEMAERQSKSLQRQYNLTDDQYKGVYAANLDFFNKRQDMMKANKQPSRAEQEEMMNTQDAKYKAAMTPEQYTKYEATRNHNGPRQPMAPGAPMPTPATQPMQH